MDESFETADQAPGARFDRYVRAFQRLELPLGLVLVAGGFLAVALGWLDASGTADVRRQLQALISGGFGGLALVLLGAILIQSQSSSRSVKRLETKLDLVAEAVLELAYLDAPPKAPGNGRTPASEPVRVVATHASYHAAGCDLVAGRESVSEVTPAQARRRGLRPCRVCIGRS